MQTKIANAFTVTNNTKQAAFSVALSSAIWLFGCLFVLRRPLLSLKIAIQVLT